MYGHFAILSPLKMITDGHFRLLKLMSFLYYQESRKALFAWTQCGEVANSIYPLQSIIYLDFLPFLAFEVWAFPNYQNWPVFILLKILSFSNDIVGPINLINGIIINYQLSIERSALAFTVIFFSLGAYVVPGDRKDVSLLHLLPLSQVANCETHILVFATLTTFNWKEYAPNCRALKGRLKRSENDLGTLLFFRI